MENMLNKIVKNGLVMLVLLTSIVCQAHQAEFSSSLLSKTDDGKYILQIASSMTAFESEIDYIYTKKAYKTAEEFQKLVLDYFTKNVSFIVNGTEVLQLKDPMVLLGHETKIIVEVVGIPSNIKEMSYTNTMFKDLSHNKMGLIMLVDGFPKEQYVLENENNQTVQLELQEGTWVSTANTELHLKKILYVIFFTILIAIPILYFGIKERKRLKTIYS